MNRTLFQFLMGAVDDSLLEEAQRPVKKANPWLRAAAMAVACLVAAVVLFWPTLTNEPPDAGGVTLEEIQRLGYSLPIPDGAEDVSYALLDGNSSDTPIAEVTYKSGGHAYSCRARKAEQPEDISGMEREWTQSLDWKVGGLKMQLRQSDGEAWVGWYAPDAETQWCLSGGEDALSLLHTAQSLLETLGYGVATAPDGAEDILYNAFALDGLTVGETAFVLNGIHYSYRMAETWDVGQDFADISGMDGSFQVEKNGEMLWCPARLSYNDGGEGKIVWFDVVPGLLYSLGMDRGASEEALLDMANQLFSPAQGDVG